jgi:hypothetical protein
MGARMTVECGERSAEDLQSLVDELTADLNQVQGADAAAESVAAPKGSRGDMISLGTIAMSFLTSGAAVAALNVLKSYFEREPALVLRVKGADGAEAELTARDVKDANTTRAIKVLEKAVARRK